MVIKRKPYSRLLILSIFFLGSITFHVEAQNEDNWDNALWLSNKLGYGTGNFHYSGELHARLVDNTRSLSYWFFEFAPSYQLNKNWEFSMPLRYSVKPEYSEFRPGLSVFYKAHANEKLVFNNQVMWQADINPNETTQAMRYVLTADWRAFENWSITGLAGGLYRYGGDFEGIELIRVGPGLTYHINEKHALNFHYFLSISDPAENATYQGIWFFQFAFNIGKGKFKPVRMNSMQ